jgi:cell volume regulation protein A
MHIDALLLSISLLLIISILIAKASKNIGVPILIIFLGVGMLAGSEGPGGIYFDNAEIAQTIGVISLLFILFTGGLETRWKSVQPVILSSLSLSTLGVLITTLAVGVFVHFVFHISFLVSLLMGAVISSTDAAAVFSILSFRSLNLKGNVRPLLEMESGTNDPMAVFLTISLIELITIESTGLLELFGFFIIQMCLGFLIGLGGGRLMVALINKLRFPIEGFYTVFALAFALLIYSLTASLKGSGFLAVYVAGVIVGNNQIVFKRSLFRIFDGIAWLAQIGMFLALGLLVYPSKLVQVTETGILISVFLIFIARPLGVFLSLMNSQFDWREKVFISWVGLRGAVPIILATFPLLAGIKQAGWIFNVVFFIVLSSTLLQGWTIALLARLLGLDAPSEQKTNYPIEFNSSDDFNMKIVNLKVPEKPFFVKKSLVEIPILKGSLVVLVSRDGHYFVPSGGTILEAGDILQVLVEKDKIQEIKNSFAYKD